MVMAVMLSVLTKRAKVLFALSTAVFVTVIFFAFFFEVRYRIRLLLLSDSTGFFVGGLLCWVMDSMNRETEQATHAINDQPGTV